MGAPRKSPDQMTGPSYAAARKLHDHGGSLRSVAEEHGVSFQAVDQAWERLYPGELTPYRKRAEERRREVLELARSGLIAYEISRRTKVQRVAALCREAGVQLQDGRQGTTPEMEAAVQLVAGGMAVVEAAYAAGVSYGRLSMASRERGIVGRPSTRPRDGRSVRAARRVMAGERVCDAARAESCTPGSVHATLLRIRAANAGSREP